MSSNLQSLADQLNAGFGVLAGESLRTLNSIAAWLNGLRVSRPDVFAADGTLLPDYAERLQQAPPELQVLPMPDDMLASESQNGNNFRFEASGEPTAAELLVALDAVAAIYIAWREGGRSS